MNPTTPAILLLEDGTVFQGTSFGSQKKRCGEVIFNTGLTGYEEIFSDPSYQGQIIVMTYPHLGNYGITKTDHESDRAYLTGIVTREYSKTASNWRTQESLATFMQRDGIVGIEGIDTQALVLHLRNHGAMRGIIAPATNDYATLLDEVRSFPVMEGCDLVSIVTRTAPYEYTPHRNNKQENPQHTVVLFDYGVKRNTPELLCAYGCRVIIVPASTTVADVLAEKPDGIMLSNGPGDPDAVGYAIDSISELLRHNIPIFGICMGNQLLSLALGAKTYKLPFGHHGINHPVKNLKTGTIEITSQNHGFAVDPHTLPHDVTMTHINLNDHTCEGIAHTTHPCFAVQYHPESYPGPHDSHYLFEQFIAMMN